MSSANMMDYVNASDMIVSQVANEAFMELFNFDHSESCMTPAKCLSNNTDSSACQQHSPSNFITLDESYLDKLIDLELRNVPSSLGLVWSKLSTSSPNEFLFETNNKTQPILNSSTHSIPTTSSPLISSPTIRKNSNKAKGRKQSVSNNSNCISFQFHQPESTVFDIKKITKRRKLSGETDMPNYRVRFSHNKFEEIEFKKSNPKGKFIIFK